jgi:hypothetical protein
MKRFPAIVERRFAHITDDEVGAVLAYLKTLK